jgi:hypothetical protein
LVEDSFIKKENDFEEIIITDKKQNVKAQILKINDCVYSERRFSHSFDCDFYFLGVKKEKRLKILMKKGNCYSKNLMTKKDLTVSYFNIDF